MRKISNFLCTLALLAAPYGIDGVSSAEVQWGGSSMGRWRWRSRRWPWWWSRRYVGRMRTASLVLVCFFVSKGVAFADEESSFFHQEEQTQDLAQKGIQHFSGDMFVRATEIKGGYNDFVKEVALSTPETLGITKKWEDSWRIVCDDELRIEPSVFVTCYQYVDQIRVELSEIVLEFDSLGKFISLAGSFHDAPTETPELSLLDAIETVKKYIPNIESTIQKGLHRRQLPRRREQPNPNNIFSEQMYSPVVGKFIWRVVWKDTIYTFDSSSFELLNLEFDERYDRNARIHYYAPNENGDTHDQPLSTTTLSVGSVELTYVEDTIPPTTVYSGICRWRLSAADISGGWAINTLVDADSSEVTTEASCNSTPTFPKAIDADLEQQAYFYHIYKARALAKLSAFDRLSGEAKSSLSIVIDDDINCNGLYSVSENRIRICNATGDNAGSDSNLVIATGVHEFGHYFNDLFGGFTYNCSGGEGRSVDELSAEAFMLAYSRYINSSLRYSPGIKTDNFDVYTNSSNRERHPSGTCSGDKYRYGRPMLQAIWQILHDVDCFETNCSNATQSQINSANDVGGSPSTLARWVIEALGYANLALPSQTTILAYADRFLERLAYRSSTVGKNAREIFVTHGLVSVKPSVHVEDIGNGLSVLWSKDSTTTTQMVRVASTPNFSSSIEVYRGIAPSYFHRGATGTNCFWVGSYSPRLGSTQYSGSVCRTVSSGGGGGGGVNPLANPK